MLAVSLPLLGADEVKEKKQTMATPAPEAREGLLDYEILDHKIIIKGLRAGNHDESGKNEYRIAGTGFHARGATSRPRGATNYAGRPRSFRHRTWQSHSIQQRQR